jgi:hypothetical protein
MWNAEDADKLRIELVTLSTIILEFVEELEKRKVALQLLALRLDELQHGWVPPSALIMNKLAEINKGGR